MITIDFDDTHLWQYGDDPDFINNNDPVAVGVTGFVLPIKFVANNVDLLELRTSMQRELRDPHEVLNSSKEGSWISMPLINFALVGLEEVRKACRGEKITFFLPDLGTYLLFEPNKDEVTIYSSNNGRTVVTNCLELLDAFEGFVSRVRSVLSEQVPQLKNFPYWKEWLEGD